MGADRVFADLAEARYDTQWCSVRASDVGAPHRRERIFILATDATGDRWDERRPKSTGFVGGSDAAERGDRPVALLPTPNAQDGNGGRQRSQKALDAGDHQANLTDIPRLLPTPRTTDANGAGAHGDGGLDLRTAVTTSTNWGRYEAAIRRWEQITRPAPAPTEPNTKGNPRLSPAFAEWMMGWPAGWVTDVPDVKRNNQLKLIGNGVCPQQAIAALQWLSQIAQVA